MIVKGRVVPESPARAAISIAPDAVVPGAADTAPIVRVSARPLEYRRATTSGVMTLADVLERFWGYTTFRPLQREAMTAVLSGRDSLVVLPTGGGKSICFQAPALVQDGLAI